MNKKYKDKFGNILTQDDVEFMSLYEIDELGIHEIKNEI